MGDFLGNLSAFRFVFLPLCFVFCAFQSPPEFISCFMDARLHTFVSLCAPGPALHQQRGSPSRFAPPTAVLWFVFGQPFVIFAVFHGLKDFGREFNFEGPGPSKCHFFFIGAP